MQTFIVLGLVPGTNIQLTFNFWLYVAIVWTASPFLLAVWRRRTRIRLYFTAFRIARVIDQYQLPA
jgi:hypothetical protein